MWPERVFRGRLKISLGLCKTTGLDKSVCDLGIRGKKHPRERKVACRLRSASRSDARQPRLQIQRAHGQLSAHPCIVVPLPTIKPFQIHPSRRVICLSLPFSLEGTPEVLFGVLSGAPLLKTSIPFTRRANCHEHPGACKLGQRFATVVPNGN